MIIKTLLLVIIITFVNVFPQTPDPVLCETSSASGPTATTWGKYKPAQTGSGEYFRALIAFAQFASDVTADDDWELDELPDWANSFIDTAVSGSYTDETISDYFDVASLGKFDFIGDVYQDTIIIPTDISYSNANEYVIDELNSNIADFSRYDNWELVSGNHVFSEGSADGYLDMLIIIYRNAGSYLNLAGGIASLGISSQDTTHDGIIISGGTSAVGSGVTTRAGLKGKFDMITHIAHEYGHYLFGGSGGWHTNFGGLMSGYPSPYYTETYMMNAWERAHLGYITPTVPSTDGTQVTLDDFVTEGDAVKIPIPFTNPSSSTFLMVENHQRSSPYDQIMRGETQGGNWDPNSELGKGIYIWLVTNGNSWKPTFDIKAADGTWDWAYDGDYYAGSGWYDGSAWEGYLPQTERSAVNRNTGKSDRYPEHIYWNNHWASKWVDKDPATGNYELTRDVMGEENDAYNLDYNELLTPWSNPSSYVDGTTNISVELVSQNGSDITVKVYSTSTSALALPPSKPQNLKVVHHGGIEGHPKLTWTSNVEPDMTSGGQYKIYRAYENQTLYPFYYVATVNHTTGGTQSYIDSAVTSYRIPETQTKYHYKVTAYDNNNQESVKSEEQWIKGTPSQYEKSNTSNENIEIPLQFKLDDNYPNPFNPETKISFSIKEKVPVKLTVYDMLGKEVSHLVNEIKEPGIYSIKYNASSLSSGIYIYTLTAGSFSESKKMILMR